MKKNFQNLSQKASFWLGAIMMGLIIGVSLQFVRAGWNEPIASAPGMNVAAPISQGIVGQTKGGGLGLNSGGAASGLLVYDKAGYYVGAVPALSVVDKDVKIAGGLNVSGYDFVQLGKIGIMLKDGAVATASCNNGAWQSETGTASVKKEGGKILVKAVSSRGCDSGWVTGATATCNSDKGTITANATVGGASLGVSSAPGCNATGAWN